MGRYSKIPIVETVRKNNNGSISKIRKYRTAYYGRTELRDTDLYFITQAGDRLDSLALQFYGNQNFWWYIARINNLKTMNVEAGIKLRIPLGASAGSNVY